MTASPVAQPGIVRLTGLLEGPRESWEPTAEAVADALGRAGVPPGILEVLDDGGRVLLEACPRTFPRAQFAGEPSSAVGLALGFLLEEGPGQMPEGWASTLRMEEFGRDRIQETLFTLTPEGVRAVARERPWTPPPPESLATRARRLLPLAILVGVAGLLGLWLRRDEILGAARDLGLPFGARSQEVVVDPGPWAGQLRTRASHTGERLEVVVGPVPEAEATDPAAGLPEAVHLEVLLADGTVLSRPLDLTPLDAGREVREVLLLPAGVAIRQVRLRP